ncbi:MerR family transcriptional regulator [Anaerobacillus arseniciselenatis]|uniref:MerR family transcriptional regulator n=1 Tax=Anaerobacillus arseniciselenatis TaxID=85682 RepID=A0A1S2LSR3_9BACI|nr:MerR family transcriptional regulator [Anaerobacillus arseniciselenatis]OIJ15173.1 MerR family transcriptional regulator [Anaerobacillus arseniciselenatis]
MEYTIQKLAQLAGVSTRTLRYYDEIEILKPARINSSGYRIYGQVEVDRLQQILFYKELGVSLEMIKKIMTSPSYDENQALKDHREQLLGKRKQLDVLITNVEKTIGSMEGRIKMTDHEKFEGFKQQLIDENEAKYGKEIREKYGEAEVTRSNEKLKNMKKDEHEEVSRLANEVQETLEEAFKTGDPSSNLAQKTAELHKKWLMYYWDEYNKDAHAGLAEMYVADERFKKYYEKKPGMTEFLRDAILIYTSN